MFQLSRPGLKCDDSKLYRIALQDVVQADPAGKRIASFPIMLGYGKQQETGGPCKTVRPVS
jgi:hypothetical protein